MNQANLKRGNIVQKLKAQDSGLLLIVSNSKDKYEVINLENNKREFYPIKHLEETTLLIAHEYNLHNKRKLQKILKVGK